MKPEHTPGPWHVFFGFDDNSIESKYQTIATYVSSCDADLIAAAPDLLAALRGLVESIESAASSGIDLTGYVGMSYAMRAIAKAEGREEPEEPASDMQEFATNLSRLLAVELT